MDDDSLPKRKKTPSFTSQHRSVSNIPHHIYHISTSNKNNVFSNSLSQPSNRQSSPKTKWVGKTSNNLTLSNPKTSPNHLNHSLIPITNDISHTSKSSQINKATCYTQSSNLSGGAPQIPTPEPNLHSKPSLQPQMQLLPKVITTPKIFTHHDDDLIENSNATSELLNASTKIYQVQSFNSLSQSFSLSDVPGHHNASLTFHQAPPSKTTEQNERMPVSSQLTPSKP